MNNLEPEDLLELRAIALQILAMKQRYKQKVHCEFDDTTNNFDSIMFKIRQIINEQYNPDNKDDIKLSHILQTTPKHLTIHNIFKPVNFRYNKKTHIGSIENNVYLMDDSLIRIHKHIFKVLKQKSFNKYIIKRLK